MPDPEYFPHPTTDMNASLTSAQREELRHFMETGEGLVQIHDHGIEITVENQPISVQSVTEALRLKRDREINLGS